MNHLVIIVGTVAVGLFAAGLALFSMFEDNQRQRPHGHGRRRSPPPRRRQPSPPPRRRQPSPPPRRRQPSPPPERPPPSPYPSGISPTPSPTRPSTTSSLPNRHPNPNPTSAVRPESPPVNVRHPQVANRNPSSRASENDSRCYQPNECLNCANDDLVTFLPCGGSYLCKGCAMEYMRKEVNCCMCPGRIDRIK